MQPLWRNFFENTATVQLDHRVLAMTTLGSIWGSYFYARSGGHWPAVPKVRRLPMNPYLSEPLYRPLAKLSPYLRPCPRAVDRPLPSPFFGQLSHGRCGSFSLTSDPVFPRPV